VNIKDFLYEELFTTADTAMDLFAQRMGTVVDYDAFGGREVFTAVVLTKPVIFAHADIDTSIPATRVLGGGTVSKFAFKARIIDDPSPHYYLPDPCELAIADDPQKQLNRTFLHTTFISADDYTESTSTLPKVGDVVNVRLTKNIFSYNTQFGQFESIVVQSSREKNTTLKSCTSIDESFLSKYQPPDAAKLHKSSTAKFVPSTSGSPVITSGKAAATAASPEELAAICEKLKTITAKDPSTYKPNGISQFAQFSKEYNLWRYSQPHAAHMKWMNTNKGITTFVRLSGPGDATTCVEGKKKPGVIDCGADTYWDTDLELALTLDVQNAIAKCFGGRALYISPHQGYVCYEGYKQSKTKIIEALKKKNILVHCAHGADRTGFAVGAWLRSDAHKATGEKMPWPRPAGARYKWQEHVKINSMIRYLCSYNSWWSGTNKGVVANPGKCAPEDGCTYNLGYAKYLDGVAPINEVCKGPNIGLGKKEGWSLCDPTKANSWEKNMGPGTSKKCGAIPS
tara:strand:- start:189 stop:1724 length:1536 start_codon:yes stop_codon:yes gene_type:complete